LRAAIAALALAAAAAPAHAQSVAGTPPELVVPLPTAAPAPPPGAVVAALGAPRAPASALLAPTAPAKPARVKLAKHWWFWASLGAAAVGVVLAAVFLGPRDPYNGNANPGTVFF
jgi:hypothetical protein